ncbi:NUDIX domain-containing protein [Candidatus Woesearchaeota archaeon]|nr:NUDIX domain-containing protein [Candidatus Woesearchaeota archaeon]
MKKIFQVKVFVFFGNRYLILRKARDDNAAHLKGWEVPGGKIKSGEDPVKAALREVREETQLDVRIIHELEFFEVKTEDLFRHTHVFLAQSPSDNVVISDEHSEYRWITPRQVDDLPQVLYREVFKKYLRKAEEFREQTLTEFLQSKD